MSRFCALVVALGLLSPLFPFSSFADSGVLYVIPIQGEIQRSTAIFVKRSLAKAAAEEATFVVFEIETPGGHLDATLEITSAIGRVDWAETIAYVVSKTMGASWSAGAIIALSCRKIYMEPGTSIGAAAPLQQQGQKLEPASEKVLSAVRGQVAALAEKNGHPVGVALAMVDDEVELYEATVGGVAHLLTSQEIERLTAKGHKVSRGKLFSEKGKLLTLTANEMGTYGIASGIERSRSSLIVSLSPEKTPRLRQAVPSAAWTFLSFITSGVVTGILLSIALAGLYFEMMHPGIGFPGAISAIAFATLCVGSFLLGTFSPWEILLLLLGIIFVIAEVFVMPGFGLAGTTGIVLIVLSLVLSRLDFIVPDSPWRWGELKRATLGILLGLGSAGVLIVLLMGKISKVPLLRTLILNAPSSSLKTKGNMDLDAILSGKQGVALTPLRPSGKALIEGETISVEAEKGLYIAKGSSVVVIGRKENRFLVRSSPCR